MTFPWAAPDINEFVITWLLPIGDPAGVGMDRPTGTILPYRMVNRVSSTDDKVFESNVVSVHTFADTMTNAETAAMATHYRMLALGPPISDQVKVTISNDQIVQADEVCTMSGPTWIDYEDNTIRRYVARYRVCLRFAVTH